MISYEDALLKITECAGSFKKQSEIISLDSAQGRILSDDLLAPENVPPFDNSSMDGFLVCASDITGPTELRVLGSVFAGENFQAEHQKNTAIEIMTGAPLVKGAWDAIVKVEEVELLEKSNETKSPLLIRVSQSISSGQFVRKAGSDLKSGEIFLKKGDLLSLEAMMACAALGISQIPVYRKPRVVLLSTGKELVPHSSPKLEPGFIRDSTKIFLKKRLFEMGFEVWDRGLVGDNVDEFQSLIQSSLEDGVDLIVTTGAVSAGRHDYVKAAIENLGAQTVFHKVAIKPGKPILFAQWPGKTQFFGLPGNPVSTVVGTRFFIQNWFRAAMGLKVEKSFTSEIKGDLPRSPLRHFLRATRHSNTVEVLSDQNSHVIHNLKDSDAWVVVGPDQSSVEVRNG